MAKKKYKQYKADPSIRTPVLAWVFDRPYIYLITAIVFIVMTGYVFYNTLAIAKTLQEPEINTPWMEIAPEETEGIEWAKNFLKTSPEKVSDWTTSQNIEMRGITAPDCSVAETTILPGSMLGTVAANGSEIEAVAQVYGAGQAISQFNTYGNLLNGCSNVEIVKDEEWGYQAYKYKNGFLMTSGDTIVNVYSVNPELLESVYTEYSHKLSESLKKSGCRNLFVNSTDSGRSFFYNREHYTGWLESLTLVSKINVKNSPEPTGTTPAEEPLVDVLEPEAPLPEGFPQMPKDVEKPSVPVAPAIKEEISREIKIEKADPIGPGCGWEWSGQISPIFNKEALNNAANNLKITTINELDTEAIAYLDTRQAWVKSIINLFPSINSWNNYVGKIAEVKEKWYWLNASREELRPQWDAYMQAMDNYNSFDGRKNSAQSDYDKAVKNCEAEQKKLEAWEKEQEEASTPPVTTPPGQDGEDPITPPTPAPTTPRPPGCPIPPERPAILLQVPPEKPIAPYIPEGVTIPNSWPQP